MIIDRLIDRVTELRNPTVVGLDPRLDQLPESFLRPFTNDMGKSLEAASAAVLAFNKEIIDAVCGLVPAVKPQIAMYEQFGAEGIACYIATCKYAREKGLVVIGDVKRGDIASTAEAYSDGHIGRVNVLGCEHEVFGEDMITVNAYLGGDSITPYLKNCSAYNKGLFVLVKTSNPQSGQLQDLTTENGRVYEIVGSLIENWGSGLIGKSGYSSVGAVVGATHREQAARLRELMPRTFFLIPGYGAQGGKAEDLAVCFDKNGIGGIVNSSRGITSAWKSEKYKSFGEDFAAAARQAVLDMREDLLKHIAL